MKTFTVRQLDRETARVMEACDTYGAVRIKRRDGRTYTLQSDHSKTNGAAWDRWWEEREKQVKAIFPDPLTRKQTRAVDRMIAGE